MAKQLEKINTHCGDCKRMTNHTVLFRKRITSYDDTFSENSPDYESHTDYMTIQCNGCDEISFLLRSIGSIFADEHNMIGHFDKNFPNSEDDVSVNLLTEEEQSNLPKILRNLYEEVEGAFREESNILAGVGLRMLVEAICLEQNIPGKDLHAQIPKLHEAGMVSANEVPILDKLRKIGNISVHEIKGFPIDKLEYALDIINHILKSIYILPKINKQLKI